MTGITPEMIEELRLLLGRATQGDWDFRRSCIWKASEIQKARKGIIAEASIAYRSSDEFLSNLCLIVKSKNALPALLDAADREARLAKALEAVKQACLYTDDDASGSYIGVTTEPYISEELFSEICAALNTDGGEQ